MDEHSIQNSFLAIFDIYINQKNKKLHRISQINQIVWANAPYFDLSPLSIELDGMHKGRLYKKAPKNLSNVVSYGFFDDKLLEVKYYDAFQKNTRIYTFTYDNSKTIILGYINGILNSVCYIYYVDFKPQYSLHLEYEDKVYGRFFKRVYLYKESEICQVRERGFIFNDKEKLGIIDVDYTVEYAEHQVSKITGKLYNHKIGTSVISVVYDRS